MNRSAYGEDLAYIHDAGFSGPATAAGPLIMAELRAAGFGSGLVVDLGCGSGILAARLGEAGYDVLGVDLSPAHVALARRKAPRANFRVESVFAAELPPCVGVAAIGEIFNYLFDESNGAEALNDLLTKIHAALAPGGALVCDVAGPGRVPAPGRTQLHRAEPDWELFATAEEDRAAGTLVREITTFRRVGELYRRSHETHRLRLIAPEEMLAALERAGFEARAIPGYGEFSLQAGWSAFIARRR